MHRLPRLLGALTVGLALAFCFDGPVHVEWSTPYCLDPHSGPAYAHFGFPVPYQRFSGASSMLYQFQPLAYAFNLLVLSLPAAVVAHRLPSRWLGGLCLLAVPWNGVRFGSVLLLFAIGGYRPVWDLTPDAGLFDYQLEGLSWGTHYACRPGGTDPGTPR